ncbi:MAG: hypothetical protein CVV44_15165 [Spirochaetae bacterium HGW-Spirochaetae-1]|jgi:hypothetical protein|nr:MAG: hypothetical protein CVV44_15165 [Spirochaetae bacterium HGW-Spirochaetae-1]
MKKVNILLMALVIALAFGTTAFAKNGLSVGVGFGTKFDCNSLGDTISNDGLDKIDDDGTNYGSAIIPENTLIAMDKLGYVKNVKDAGSITAFDFAINARYDMLNYLFVRTGFNYNSNFGMTKTSWKYDGTNGTVSALGLIDAKQSQTWEYSSWAIPIQLGLNIPISEGKYNIYMGMGITMAKGTWSLKVKAPAQAYQLFTGDANGAIDTKVTFDNFGVGLNYLLGVDAEVYDNLFVFVEMEYQFVAGMSKAETVKDADAIPVLGTNTMAYPVVSGGAIYRVGVKYHLGFASI